MSNSQNNGGFVSIKKQILNIGSVVLLTVIVFAIILLNNKEFSFKEFFSYLTSLNVYYVIGAFVCMLLFIFFEG